MTRAAIVCLLLGACGSRGGGGGTVYNAGPDEGPAEPQLLVSASPGPDSASNLAFTPDGRNLVGLTRVVIVWELDAAGATLREAGWFGFAEDRSEPAPDVTSDPSRLEEWISRHEGIRESVLTPDGRHVVAAGRERLAVWRLQPGSSPVAKKVADVRLAAEPGGDRDDQVEVWGLAVAPDGRRLLVMRRGPEGTDAQGAVEAWDLAGDGGLRRRGIILHEDRPSAAAFTADGRFAVVIGSSQTVLVMALDGDAGVRLAREEKGDDTYQAIVALPGDRFATGGFDQAVRLWRLERTPEPHLVDEGFLGRAHRGKIGVLAAAPDARWLAAASVDHTLSLWPLAARQPGGTVAPIVITPPDEHVYGLAAHPHGPYLATGGDEVRIWRVNRALLAGGRGARPPAASRRRAVLAGTQFLAADWSGDDTLVTASSDGSVRRWRAGAGDLAEEAVLRAPAPVAEGARVVAAVRGGVAVVAWPPGGLVVVDSATGAQGETPVPEPPAEVALAGACVVTAAASGAVTAWRRDGVSLAQAGSIDAGLAHPAELALTADASLLVTAGTGPDNAGVLALHALDPATCAPTASARVPIPNTPSGSIGSSVSYPGGGGAAPIALAFSADGRWLLSGDRDGGGAVLWRVDAAPAPALTKVDFLLGHTAGVMAVAFSPDGRRAVTGGDGGETFLWALTLGDAPAFARLDLLQPASQPAYFHHGAAFSPGGGRVVLPGGWSDHGRLWVYDLATE